MQNKNKVILVALLLIGIFVFTPLVLAASSDFLAKATEYYERNCKRNPNRLSRETSLNCYLFDKVAELDQAFSNLDSRLDQNEADEATQSAKIVELEQRISELENTPSPSASPTIAYIISDNTWKFSATEVNGWLGAGFDDSSWITTQAPSGGQCSPSAIGLLINEQGALPMSVSDPNWAGGSGYFRKTFNLGSIPSSASVRVVLDDDGDLYVNGNLVLTDHDNHVAGIQQVNIDTSKFVNGTNVIGLVVIDSAGGCQHAQVEVAINP